MTQRRYHALVLEKSGTVPSTERTGGRGKDGRYSAGTSGNPKGRPKGARNKATKLRDVIEEGDEQAIIEQCVRMARRGDRVVMRVVMERLFPRLRSAPISIELPEIKTISDAKEAVGKIIDTVASGELNVDEATKLCRLIEAKRKLILTLRQEASLPLDLPDDLRL